MIEAIESPYIHAATDSEFKQLVLDNSEKGPVLVNFWSKKAGPCLRQYPILDKLVHAYKSKFLLVNVNADTEVIACKEYGISSLPTLKLFRHQQILKTLHGFQDETELRLLLEAHISRDSDQVLAEALNLYHQSQADKAYEMIADAIMNDPDNPRLPLTLAKLLMHEQRFDEAQKLLNALPAPINQQSDIVQIRERLYFYNVVINIELDEKQLLERDINVPDNWENKLELVAHYVMTEQIETGLIYLLNLLTKNQHREIATQTLQRIFSLLTDETLKQKYRSQLQTLLN